MAFVLEVVPSAHLDNQAKIAMAPSKDFLASRDPRFAAHTSFLPWHRVQINGAAQLVPVIGYDHLAGLLFDRLRLPLSVLPEAPSIEWTRLRVHCREFTRLLTTAAAAGLPALEYKQRRCFLAALDLALGSLDEWPAVDGISVEYSLPVDFNTMPQHRWLQPLENVAVQQLRSGERVKGWAMLSQTMAPYWDVADRYGVDSTFLSASMHWMARVEADPFDGNMAGVRPAMISDAAAQVIQASQDWEGSSNPKLQSVEREKEFKAMIQLGSSKIDVRERAFGSKLWDMVQLDTNAHSFRLIMGRTANQRELYTWYRRLCSALVKEADVFQYTVFKQVNGALKGRLAFLETDRGRDMCDEERVEEVINVKSQFASGVSSVVLGGAAAEDCGLVLTGAKGRNFKMEKLHLSKRHQEAVISIRKVVERANATQEDVVTAFLKCAIPAMSQWILGKIELDGHELYEECSKWRCVWHGDNDVEEVLGRAMAQAILPKDQYSQFTLASGAESGGRGASLVQKFLKGQTKAANLENEVLREVTFAKSGRREALVPDKDRFTDYKKVDRLIAEVTPLFALFGLGEAHEPDSFGVVMGEVKSMLADIEGLAPIDQEDLVHSSEVSVLRFVKDAMHAGDRVLQRLFQTKDPLAEVEPDRFLQYNVAAIKDTLREVRDGVKDRQKEQRRFKSSYDMRTGELHRVGGQVHFALLSVALGA